MLATTSHSSGNHSITTFPVLRRVSKSIVDLVGKSFFRYSIFDYGNLHTFNRSAARGLLFHWGHEIQMIVIGAYRGDHQLAKVNLWRMPDLRRLMLRGLYARFVLGDGEDFYRIVCEHYRTAIFDVLSVVFIELMAKKRHERGVRVEFDVNWN
jgi:hypothetical protein